MSHEASTNPDQTRKGSVTESIVYRGPAADIVAGRGGNGGRGGGNRINKRKTHRSASMQMDFDADGGYDAYSTDASNASETAAESDISALLPPAGNKPKPPPPPAANKPKPPPPPPGKKPPPPAPPSSDNKPKPPPPPAATKPKPPPPPVGPGTPPRLAMPPLPPAAGTGSGPPKLNMPPPPPAAGTGTGAPPLPNPPSVLPSSSASVGRVASVPTYTKSQGGKEAADDEGGKLSEYHHMDPSGYEVVIHSNVSKRGKLKWNSRYTVLIKPKSREFAPPNNRTGSLFYFKHAKQFMKQAREGGGGSVSVDVARLFAPPAKGKEVPKELLLQGCRVEGSCDEWSTPAGSFGFLVVDDKGVEYPFATDSAGLRNQWVAALDTTINLACSDSESEDDEFASTTALAPMHKGGGAVGGSSSPMKPGGRKAAPGGVGSYANDPESDSSSALVWKRGNAEPTKRAVAKATAVDRGMKLGLLKSAGSGGAEADGFALLASSGVVVPQPEYAALRKTSASVQATSASSSSTSSSSSSPPSATPEEEEDKASKRLTLNRASSRPTMFGSLGSAISSDSAADSTRSASAAPLPTAAAVAAALAPPALELVTGLGGSSATAETTVDLTVALRLLEDRRFLRTRKAVEKLMKELLEHVGDPADIARLVAQTRARDKAQRSTQQQQQARGGRSASQAPAAAASDEGGEVETGGSSSSGGGDESLGRLLGRLVELLSLEPIESPSTSRIVGCSLAIITSMVKGSTDVHKILSTYPLLGELGFELRALLAKSEHPGIHHQAARLIGAVMEPAKVPTIPHVSRGPPTSSALSAPAPSIHAATTTTASGAVKLDLDDDDDVGVGAAKENKQRQQQPTSPTMAAIAAASTLSAETAAGDVCGAYLRYLKSAQCPLWQPLFTLASSHSEQSRRGALRLLADFSTELDVAVAICSAHEPQNSLRNGLDRKAAGKPPPTMTGRGLGSQHASGRFRGSGDFFFDDDDDDDYDDDLDLDYDETEGDQLPFGSSSPGNGNGGVDSFVLGPVPGGGGGSNGGSSNNLSVASSGSAGGSSDVNLENVFSKRNTTVGADNPMGALGMLRQSSNSPPPPSPAGGSSNSVGLGASRSGSATHSARGLSPRNKLGHSPGFASRPRLVSKATSVNGGGGGSTSTGDVLRASVGGTLMGGGEGEDERSRRLEQQRRHRLRAKKEKSPVVGAVVGLLSAASASKTAASKQGGGGAVAAASGGGGGQGRAVSLAGGNEVEADGALEVRRLCLRFLCNLLVHACSFSGITATSAWSGNGSVEAILRAVCIPDLMGSVDTIAAIHETALRRVGEGVAAAKAARVREAMAIEEAKLGLTNREESDTQGASSPGGEARTSQRSSSLTSNPVSPRGSATPPPPPPPGVQFADLSSPPAASLTLLSSPVESSSSYDQSSVDTALALATQEVSTISLRQSAKLVAAEQEVADACAQCLWFVGCLLTQHRELAGPRGLKPHESFEAFAEKLSGGALL